MGAVATGLTWTSNKVAIKAYLNVDGTDFDTLLEALFNSAVARADSYLNNPFEEIEPTIALSSIVVGDYVTVNGASFTARTALDEDEREFAVESTDSATADNLCALINSTTLGGSYGAVGVAGVLATNVTGTITLTKIYPNATDITCSSSDEDRLLVRHVRTAQSLPNAILQWVMQDMYRNFENRQALMQETVTGQGVRMYTSLRGEESGMSQNFDLIAMYRLIPGL
jgi:hypothetical protein